MILAQRFGEARSALGNDHEFLDVDRSIRVGAAVEDVRHRNGKHLGVGSADVFEKRKAELAGCGVRGGKRNGQKRVCSELALVWRAVEFDHRFVEGHLVQGVQFFDGRSDDIFDVRDRFKNAFAGVNRLVAIAKLPRFVFAGAGSAGNRRAAHRAAGEFDVGFNSWIPARIEDLAGTDFGNIGR